MLLLVIRVHASHLKAAVNVANVTLMLEVVGATFFIALNKRAHVRLRISMRLIHIYVYKCRLTYILCPRAFHDVKTLF